MILVVHARDKMSRGACVTFVTFVVSRPTSSSVIVSHVPTVRHYLCYHPCIFRQFFAPQLGNACDCAFEAKPLHLLHVFPLCLVFSKRECVQLGAGNICAFHIAAPSGVKNREIQTLETLLPASVQAMECKKYIAC